VYATSSVVLFYAVAVFLSRDAISRIHQAIEALEKSLERSVRPPPVKVMAQFSQP